MKLANHPRIPNLGNGDDQLWQRSLPGIYTNFQDEHTPDAVDGKRHFHFVQVVISVFNGVIHGQRNITYHLKLITTSIPNSIAVGLRPLEQAVKDGLTVWEECKQNPRL